MSLGAFSANKSDAIYGFTIMMQSRLVCDTTQLAIDKVNPSTKTQIFYETVAVLREMSSVPELLLQSYASSPTTCGRDPNARRIIHSLLVATSSSAPSWRGGITALPCSLLSGTSSSGRLKYTTEYRGCCSCAPGGETTR